MTQPTLGAIHYETRTERGIFLSARIGPGAGARTLSVSDGAAGATPGEGTALAALHRAEPRANESLASR